jgi:DNA-nicking Smr family endonuclease
MKQKKSSSPLLDLHGVLEAEVFDKVDKFIHKHSQSGVEQVKIMPGKGKGIVKKKVIEYLRLGNYPFKPEKDNDGVLIVFI